MTANLPTYVGRSARRFHDLLDGAGLAPPTRTVTTTLQINVGKRCNQACNHCHVEAGPKRTEEMSRETADRVIELLRATPSIETVDITGGAPELNPHFRRLVSEARRRGHEVIDRCNLTILSEPGMADLGEFLAAEKVHIIASLPCYGPENVDEQRGRGVFAKSIAALSALNRLGYGREDSGLVLDLVYNPLGSFLPPPQERLQASYKVELGRKFGIVFNRLLTITNMPISRFAHYLERTSEYDSYMELLHESFNPHTVAGLMCRSMVSVGYDGKLYDCDFNQMLELGIGVESPVVTIWEIDSFADFQGGRIATGSHCLGCTAGSGSSCGGAVVAP